MKVGTGAFIKSLEQARELASTMVGLGLSHGVATVAQLTSMNAPLGRAVGNALEVTESVDVLQAEAERRARPDPRPGAVMVDSSGSTSTRRAKLDDGSALRSYDE